MKCKQCGVEFEGRADAKFCSAKCRVTDSRNKERVTDNSVTDNVTLNVTDKIEIVPADEWRREYMEEHAAEFIQNYAETKDCKYCNAARRQFGNSKYRFCANHLKIWK